MSAQPTIRYRPKSPLYVMAKPAENVACEIATIDRNDPRRSAALLHTTILPLFDLGYAPDYALPAIIELLRRFEGNPFPLIFDRIEERKAVTLRSSLGLVDAVRCQRRLIDHLVSAKFPVRAKPPALHMTINYRGDGLGVELIKPVHFLVNELLLIESVYGEGRHVVHTRIPLTDRVEERFGF